jgi:hypothetical protein
LLALAHVSTLCSSADHDSTLLASIIKYVSSAGLQTSFSEVLGRGWLQQLHTLRGQLLNRG